MGYVIHKFPIQATTQHILTDPSARFIHMAMQRGVPCVWAIVDTDVPIAEIVLEVFGTGHDGLDPARHAYIGTWQDEPQLHVWHLFKVKSVPVQPPRPLPSEPFRKG